MNPHNKDIRDIPGLAPPAPAARRLLYVRSAEHFWGHLRGGLFKSLMYRAVRLCAMLIYSFFLDVHIVLSSFTCKCLFGLVSLARFFLCIPSLNIVLLETSRHIMNSLEYARCILCLISHPICKSLWFKLQKFDLQGFVHVLFFCLFLVQNSLCYGEMTNSGVLLYSHIPKRKLLSYCEKWFLDLILDLSVSQLSTGCFVLQHYRKDCKFFINSVWDCKFF